MSAYSFQEPPYASGTPISQNALTADPLRDPTATRLRHLSYMEVLNRGLTVMDNTALTLCMDNGTPIIVFDLLAEGSIDRVVLGEDIGTRVDASAGGG